MHQINQNMRLFLYHPPLNSIFLINHENDRSICYTSEINKEFVEKAKNYLKNVLPTGDLLGHAHINPSYSDLKEVFRNLEAQYSLIPYSIDRNPSSLDEMLKGTKGLIYGVTDEIEEVRKTLLSFKSKIKAAKAIRKILPDYANEFTSSSKENLEKIALDFMRSNQCEIIIKPEYGQGGFGSAIISSAKELNDFVKELAKGNYVPTLEVPIDNQFIIEKYLQRVNLPSSSSVVGSNILNDIFLPKSLLKYDHKSKNLHGVGFMSPMSSSFGNEINHAHSSVSEYLENNGYLGIFGLSSIQTTDSIKFCELNCRFPDSFYLSSYVQRFFPNKSLHAGPIYIPIKSFSFEYLENICKGRLYNPQTEEGIIPYSCYQINSEQIILKLGYLSSTMENAAEGITEVKRNHELNGIN
ncbi:ATP-grasp domain-containing protein [Candidatus Woesearchaeota archaeon]|mgnify:FL=1|jgi:hypothetical protein|nr:ATP-grasp domain-containing protein [Candidatus Woesearchaeota archaeon]MBT4247725.1 ATP-grasp domain-containing protein [Candidatus Woesearchaeota archaeon]MBT4434441.1 ATP-grasp domain-containing protein [Candidatus Woesearchaeota archaeon]